MAQNYDHRERETEQDSLMGRRSGPQDKEYMMLQETPSVVIATPGVTTPGTDETIVDDFDSDDEGGTARLPPLDDSRTGDKSRSSKPRLPPIDTGVPHPEYATSDTIISLPEGSSVGGMRPSESSRGRAVDTVIYTMDKEGVHFTLDDGQTAKAGELFEYMMEELKLPVESREVFSLWLVSDLLEVQLKPNHVPFRLACYWDELLEKYTSAADEDIERDEPILMFQRNVFFPRSLERELDNPEILRLLYHEAKENVVDARYPLSEEDCDKLAGFQAHIEQQGFIGSEHTPQFYKDKVDSYYPGHLAKNKWSLFSSKEKVEDRLVGWHRAASKKLEGQPLHAAYRKYLEFCWTLPYYGAAFFRGQVEHPGQPILKSAKDDPVYVAINTDGIFIIDMDDVVFLLGLLYEDMSWEYAEPCDRANKNCMPCLFLQFQDQEKGERVSKVLQIFSREAMLMDALIECCVDLKKQNRGEDSVDGLDEDGDGIIKSDSKTWRQFSRLSLATFKEGKINTSSLKKPSMKKKK